MQNHRTRLLAATSVVALGIGALAWAADGARPADDRAAPQDVAGILGSMPVFGFGTVVEPGTFCTVATIQAVDDGDATSVPVHLGRSADEGFAIRGVKSDGTVVGNHRFDIDATMRVLFGKNGIDTSIATVDLVDDDGDRIPVDTFDVRVLPFSRSQLDEDLQNCDYIALEFGIGAGLNAQTGTHRSVTRIAVGIPPASTSESRQGRSDRAEDDVPELLLQVRELRTQLEAEHARRIEAGGQPEVHRLGSMPVFGVGEPKPLPTMANSAITVTASSRPGDAAAAVYMIESSFRYYRFNGTLVENVSCPGPEAVFTDYQPGTGRVAIGPAANTTTNHRFEQVPIRLTTERAWEQALRDCTTSTSNEIEYVEATLVFADRGLTQRPTEMDGHVAVIRIDVDPSDNGNN